MWSFARRLGLAVAALLATTAALRLFHVHNATTVALAYLLVVLFVASLGDVRVAIATSLTATLCFNFFFLPPVGTFTIAELPNWVALVSFLVVSVVASRLSTTARLRAQEAFEERLSAERASQRAELASALLASLSHDLRTPLTAIRTAVSNLDSPMLSEAQRREQAAVAAGEVERLKRLFDEILDMARIDAGSVQPQRSWTTPAEIVEAAISRAAGALLDRDVRVEARDDRTVNVDPRLAASALAHLLENAARYSTAGAIVVRGWTDDAGLRLEVRDAGPGVAPPDLERLFEPFYRGQFARGVPGTGMGLAITRGLVTADGGRVWAENLVPGGACFSIAVPAPSRVLTAAELT